MAQVRPEETFEQVKCYYCSKTSIKQLYRDYWDGEIDILCWLSRCNNCGKIFLSNSTVEYVKEQKKELKELGLI